MEVRVIGFSEPLEKLAFLAAKLCYNSKDIDVLLEEASSSKDLNSKFIEKVLSFGHESIVEHISFSFLIEGVSRALLAQITRHRIASYSVKSQRYVLEDNFKFVIPPEIENDDNIKKIFLEAITSSKKCYSKILKILTEKHKQKYLLQGLKENKAKERAEKDAAEDARFVLPNACCTSFVVTMNARSLLNFFSLRCCNRAQWEIRSLAFEMLRKVYPLAPSIFKKAGPPCVRGVCPEGAMSCKMAYDMKCKIKKIKGEVD